MGPVNRVRLDAEWVNAWIMLPVCQVWARELVDGFAVLLYNANDTAPCDIAFELEEVGFELYTRCSCRDLYAGTMVGAGLLGAVVQRDVPVHGVRMLKCTPD
jgi:hypothetical protein